MTPVTDRKTRLVRVPEDLADMVKWVAEFANETVADTLDPILRPTLTERFGRIREQVEAIAAIKAAHAPDLGDPGA